MAWEKIGCMYGVLEAVIGTLGDKYGAPYNTSGRSHRLRQRRHRGRSPCGTVNAAGMLFGPLAKARRTFCPLRGDVPLVRRAVARLQNRKPLTTDPEVTSVSGSNLCHVSPTRWPTSTEAADALH